MILREKTEEGKPVRGYTGKDRRGEKIAERTISALSHMMPHHHPLNNFLFKVTVDGSLQILVFVFEGAAACGDSVGGLFCLFLFFCLQHLTEEPEDGIETHPGGQLMPLCACST